MHLRVFIVRELKHKRAPTSPFRTLSALSILLVCRLLSRTRSAAGAGTNSSAVLARTQFFASGAFLHPARTSKSHSLLSSSLLVRRCYSRCAVWWGSLYSWLLESGAHESLKLAPFVDCFRQSSARRRVLGRGFGSPVGYGRARIQ